jgi:hypothetical protein
MILTLKASSQVSAANPMLSATANARARACAPTFAVVPAVVHTSLPSRLRALVPVLHQSAGFWCSALNMLSRKGAGRQEILPLKLWKHVESQWGYYFPEHMF